MSEPNSPRCRDCADAAVMGICDRDGSPCAPIECSGYDALELVGVVNRKEASIQLKGFGAGDIIALEPRYKPIYHSSWHWLKCWLKLSSPAYYIVTQRFQFLPCQDHKS